MLVPAIISAVAACVYPFLKWNHKHGAPEGYGPYQFVDESGNNEKIVINGTITYKEEEEKPMTPSQKRRWERFKKD